LKIKTIAFEGINRCGKGTQIGLLSEFLRKKEIPFLTIRGDGSRSANGEPGNPCSDYWDEINKEIHENLEAEIWHLAADRLARELVYWRFRFLPKQMKLVNAKVGYLILDRSILSRAMVCLEKTKKHLSFQDLYPRSLNCSGVLSFNIADISPDKIFLFSTTKEVLISRLDVGDPNYIFRRTLIEKKWDWYDRYLQYCPTNIVNKTIKIDAAKSSDEIHEIVLKNAFN